LVGLPLILLFDGPRSVDGDACLRLALERLGPDLVGRSERGLEIGEVVGQDRETLVVHVLIE
jgi:hypothetical protein